MNTKTKDANGCDCGEYNKALCNGRAAKGLKRFCDPTISRTPGGHSHDMPVPRRSFLSDATLNKGLFTKKP